MTFSLEMVGKRRRVVDAGLCSSAFLSEEFMFFCVCELPKKKLDTTASPTFLFKETS